jgi:prolyl oligopeptidase
MQYQIRLLTRHKTSRQIATLIAAALLTAATFAADAPPAAPSQPVTDVLHGVSVADPFRNLENVKQLDTQAWLKAQGNFAESQLARIDGRDAIAARVEALAKASGDAVRGIMRMPGERIFYLKRKVGGSQLKLMLRVGINGTERVLVDPEAMAKAAGVPHAINYFMPSWDGKTLAYGISAGGSEDASLRFMDLLSGKDIGKPIPRVHESLVHWTPDSRYVTFNQIRQLPKGAPDTETFLDTTVFIIEARKPNAKPRALFGPLVNRELKLDRLDVAAVFFAPDSRYMIARTTDTTVPEGRIYVAPLDQLQQKTIAWQPIATAADKITEVQLAGNTFYFRTYNAAPRGRVMALLLDQPAPNVSKATLTIPEPEVGVLRSFEVGRDGIFTEIRQGFNTRAYWRAMAQTGGGSDVASSLPGSTFITSDPARVYAGAWLSTSTWTDTPRLLAVNVGTTDTANATPKDTGLLNNVRPEGAPELEVSEVLVTSHDGAKVPLAILRKKGLALDGNNPTLLVGYAAYGFSFDARFDPRSIAWLERGGVLAYANVRGSGAYGDAWYRAGFKATKSNTWKDGVACAQYLINERYASAKTLGVWGTSAGGIFVGRSVTSAPELFAAAIMDVGVMDAVRAEESANGITNISEFGSYKNAAEFPALLDMSTYHQIKDNTAYPAVMFIHGMNDPRVDVWHSAKAAARFQAASTSSKPILMRLDGQAGHGVGSTAQQGFSKQADIYSFLLWQFGKMGLKP